MTARLVDGSDTEREAEAQALLEKDTFAAGRGNAAVRRQVREMHDDIDLFELGEEAFAEIWTLHARLTSLLHPGAPAAAQLLIQYIEELGGERPHSPRVLSWTPPEGNPGHDGPGPCRVRLCRPTGGQASDLVESREVVYEPLTDSVSLRLETATA
jgi:hypothetical protein